MNNVECYNIEIEVLYNWINYSNLERAGASTSTPVQKLSDLYFLHSNSISSNCTSVL